MASICNDERVRLGAMSGHERKTFNLSDLPAHLRPGGTDVFVLKPYSLADLSRAFAAV